MSRPRKDILSKKIISIKNIKGELLLINFLKHILKGLQSIYIVWDLIKIVISTPMGMNIGFMIEVLF